jgi:hypothetical protein
MSVPIMEKSRRYGESRFREKAGTRSKKDWKTNESPNAVGTFLAA